MQNLTPTNIVLLFLGLIFHFCYAVIKAKKQKKDFLLGFYFKDNVFLVIATIVAAFASLLMASDLLKLFHVQADDGSPFFTIHAFVSGIMPMFFVSKLQKLYKAGNDE